MLARGDEVRGDVYQPQQLCSAPQRSLSTRSGDHESTTIFVYRIRTSFPRQVHALCVEHSKALRQDCRRSCASRVNASKPLASLEYH